MRTDVKITFLMEDPMLRTEKNPNDDRICSSAYIQKLLNTWITTGVLIKTEEVVLPNGFIRHRILRKKEA